MKYMQSWQARAVMPEGNSPWFPAEVPGSVQYDYARMMGWGDVSWADNCERYRALEDYAWEYRTTLSFEEQAGEQAVFVSEGIDYRFGILLDGEKVMEHEGMFTRIELDVSGRSGSELTVRIHPHPKREGAPEDRCQADQSVKPPVCYEWDWHPRLLVSGMWQEAWVELRKAGYIRRCEPFVELSEDNQRAVVRFEVDCDAQMEIILFDPDGNEVGRGAEITLTNPRLWWCNGQGEAALYRYVARTESHEVTGTVGIRRVRLVMNEGAWDEPAGFPKGRSVAPIQLELNGRRVFAKGSNWVGPEIFAGRLNEARYEELVHLAKDANMNIFRCWGGSGINKRAFYDLCDQMGIMVWVEFPLACNNYIGTPEYLRILEQEASAIICDLRSHPSVVLWCGGNELFNNWSGMTDQSLALRLLNKLCYELDEGKPFIMTSPIFGMAHGGYTFVNMDTQQDVFTMFQASRNTAYTEFGVPGLPSAEYLARFIPEDQLFPIKRDSVWKLHHAFDSWGEPDWTCWLCLSMLERYASGPLDSLEKVVAQSQWLQSEGYKAIFEEARRQAPYCSMAINWCYGEPWMTAANNSLISYPAEPKAGYHAVKQALRPVMASARIPKFDWQAGECFTAQIWLLNDSPAAARREIAVSIELNGVEYPLLTWDSGETAANENRIGPSVNWVLPDMDAGDMTLILRAADGADSRYRLCYRSRAAKRLWAGFNG